MPLDKKLQRKKVLKEKLETVASGHCAAIFNLHNGASKCVPTIGTNVAFGVIGARKGAIGEIFFVGAKLLMVQ